MSRLEQIQKLLEREPDDVFLNFGLAMEYTKAARHADAVAQFERIHRIDPSYIPAYFQKGNTLIAAGDEAGARSALQQGIAVARQVGDQHAVGEMTDLLERM